jgi:hypothetical protein
MRGRGLRGRRRARRILFTAIALDAFVVLLFAAQPTTMGGPFGPPPLTAYVVPAFGVLLNVVGLAWMVRIVRADPEAGPTGWRATRDR